MRLKLFPILIAIILLTVIVRPTMSLTLQVGDQAMQFKGNQTRWQILCRRNHPSIQLAPILAQAFRSSAKESF